MPGVIYQPVRNLYNGLIQAIPGAVGSGILAAKSGYHSSRSYNQRRFPGNYSITLPLDKQGPADGAAAVDVTMSTANMKKYTKLIMDAMDRNDPRVSSIKEVIGTVDGRNVVRYTRSSRTGKPVWASSDRSHLWHIHISIFRADINNWDRLRGIVEVVGGSPASGTEGVNPLINLREGDKGEAVRALQHMLDRAGFKPGKVDGDYGPNTAGAVLRMRKSLGSSAKDGKRLTGAAYDQLMAAYVKAVAPKPAPAPKPEVDVKKSFPRLGDEGTEVQYWQRALEMAGIEVDITGVYDAQTKAAVAAWFHRASDGDTYSGDAITSWIALHLQLELLKGEKGDPGEPGELRGLLRLQGIVEAEAADTE